MRTEIDQLLTLAAGNGVLVQLSFKDTGVKIMLIT